MSTRELYARIGRDLADKAGEDVYGVVSRAIDLAGTVGGSQAAVETIILTSINVVGLGLSALGATLTQMKKREFSHTETALVYLSILRSGCSIEEAVGEAALALRRLNAAGWSRPPARPRPSKKDQK